MTASNREPEFPEPNDPDKRAQTAVEEAGGLPENNPFTELVEELRADGRSWDSISRSMNQVLDVVGEGAIEEETTMIAEWRVVAKVPEPSTPSGYRYKEYERTAVTATKAEEVIEEHTGYDVVREKTEQVGYGKFS